MRIAYLCSDVEIPLLGHEGCSIHIRQLTDALSDGGHDVLIVCAWLGEDLGGRPRSRYVRLGPDSLDADTWDLLEQDPAVTSGNLERDLRSLLFNAWLPRGAGPIFDREPPELIYERYSLFGIGGIELARQRQIPLILEVNTRLSLEQEGYVKFPFSATAAQLEERVFRSADAVVAVSDSLREWIVSMGVDDRRVHVIPNAVSRKLYADSRSGIHLRRRLGLDGAPIIGFVGSFQPWHDVRGLLCAFARVHAAEPEARLILAGSGSRQPEIRRTAERLGITSAVVPLGHVPHDEVPDVIAAMDIAVAPYDGSVDLGFLPIKLFEYMAGGRATVAAAVGEIPRFIDEGVSGCTYPAGDESALAATLVRLLADPDRRRRIGEAARAKILSDYTWEAAATKVSSLAESLIRR